MTTETDDNQWQTSRKQRAEHNPLQTDTKERERRDSDDVNQSVAAADCDVSWDVIWVMREFILSTSLANCLPLRCTSRNWWWSLVNWAAFLFCTSLTISCVFHVYTVSWCRGKRKKGNEEYLCSAFIQRLVSMRSDMDHTVLPANYTMPAFPS